MSPAAVDLIPLPPIEPPSPAAPPANSAARNEPSFRDHLQQAERRSSDADSSSTNDTTASTTDARASQESKDGEKSTEKKSDDATSQSDAVAETKDKQQDEEAADKKDQETSAECVVAAVVAPQEVDATELLKVDVMEVSADALALAGEVPAAAQTAAELTAAVVVETAAIVVQTTTETPVEPEAAAAPTEAITELEATVDLTAVKATEPVADTVTITAANEQPQVSELHATQQAAAATIVPTTAVVAAATETDAPIGDEKTESKTEAAASSAPTATVDPVAQQVVAAVQAIVDAGTATTDDRSQRRDHDSKDGARIDSHRETTRTDRPHLPEPARNVNGRETGGSRAPASDGSTQLSQSDRVRLVERVARAVRTAESRGGDLKIRLSPPELGSLRLQVKLTDGTMSARIEAETPEARQVLIDNLPQLREKLSDQNIRIEKFDIDLFNSGYGGAPQHSREEHDQAMFTAGRRRSEREASTVETSGAAAPRSSGSLGRSDGRLDITI